MNQLKNIVELNMGDWSDDGHGKTQSLIIQTNLTTTQISAAFDKGVKKIGLDITKCCINYEDNSLTKEQLEALKEAGWNLDNCWSYKYAKDTKQLDEEDSFSLSPDEFVAIYIFTIQQGSSKFEYKKLDTKQINIGGYGLFY